MRNWPPFNHNALNFWNQKFSSSKILEPTSNLSSFLLKWFSSENKPSPWSGSLISSKALAITSWRTYGCPQYYQAYSGHPLVDHLIDEVSKQHLRGYFRRIIRRIQGRRSYLHDCIDLTWSILFHYYHTNWMAIFNSYLSKLDSVLFHQDLTQPLPYALNPNQFIFETHPRSLSYMGRIHFWCSPLYWENHLPAVNTIS